MRGGQDKRPHGALRTRLHTGDQVEIVTQKTHHPSKDWLNSWPPPARSKIRSYVRESERSRAVSLGKDMLDKELRKKGHTLQRGTERRQPGQGYGEFSYKDTDHLVATVPTASSRPGRS